MALIHFVTSVLVGGQTGKSLFSLMLTGFLSQREARPIVLVDTSHGAPLYYSVRNLFGQRKEEMLAGHPCFVVPPKDDTDCSLIVVHPKQAASTSAKEVLTALSAISAGIRERVGADPGQIVCESNLPLNAMESAQFLDGLRGGRGAAQRLYWWTTWNSQALLDNDSYVSIEALMMATRPEKTTLYFVHNPFAEAGQPPHSPSPSANACHALPLSSQPLSVDLLWQKCGVPASQVPDKRNSELVWEGAYAEFSDSRPYNLLPIFMSSKRWQSDYTRDRFEKVAVIHDHRILASRLDEVSEGMYQHVFEPYFAKLEW